MKKLRICVYRCIVCRFSLWNTNWVTRFCPNSLLNYPKLGRVYPRWSCDSGWWSFAWDIIKIGRRFIIPYTLVYKFVLFMGFNKLSFSSLSHLGEWRIGPWPTILSLYISFWSFDKRTLITEAFIIISNIVGRLYIMVKSSLMKRTNIRVSTSSRTRFSCDFSTLHLYFIIF